MGSIEHGIPYTHLDGTDGGKAYAQLECIEELVCEGEPCCQGERDPLNDCECPALPVVDYSGVFDNLNADASWMDWMDGCRSGDLTEAAAELAEAVFDNWS